MVCVRPSQLGRVLCKRIIPVEAKANFYFPFTSDFPNMRTIEPFAFDLAVVRISGGESRDAA